MKFLLDNMLSHRLLPAIHARYPGSAHVRDFALIARSDREIWEFAGAHGYTILTKDSDFNYLAELLGPPPEVVSVQIGNATSDQFLAALSALAPAIARFAADPEAALLVLPPATS